MLRALKMQWFHCTMVGEAVLGWVFLNTFLEWVHGFAVSAGVWNKTPQIQSGDAYISILGHLLNYINFGANHTLSSRSDVALAHNVPSSRIQCRWWHPWSVLQFPLSAFANYIKMVVLSCIKCENDP